MLTRLSFNQKRSEINCNQQNTNSNQNEKENIQKNLNRSKRTSRLSNLDTFLMAKPTDTKNYQTNADMKLNLSMNYASGHQGGQFRPKLSSRNVQRQKIQITPLAEKRKTNTQQFCQLYGKDILAQNQFKPTLKNDFLKNHEITPMLRARMLDWMVEVMKSYKFSNKTYFSSVQIMDRYFAQVQKQVPVNQLHITGVTSMFVSTKMDEIYPLKIKTVYQKIVHKKISKEALVDMQMRLFSALNHKVNSWTFFDLAILKIADKYQNEDSSVREKMQEIISFVSKFILYDYSIYTQYDIETLAQVVVSIAAQICKLSTKIEGVEVKRCKQEVIECFKNFKHSYKGLNNLFKFADEKIISLTQEYCQNEENTN